MTKTPRIKIPDSVRDYVFQRDRYQCQGCGRQQGEVRLQGIILFRWPRVAVMI